MSVSPDVIARVAELRDKARAGTLSMDDSREAIRFLRAERLAMPAPSKAKKTVAVNVDNLFGELDGL